MMIMMEKRRLALILIICTGACFAGDKSPNPNLGEMWMNPVPKPHASGRNFFGSHRPSNLVGDDAEDSENVYDGCSSEGHTLSEAGVIQSQGYPSKYLSNLNCSYSIQAPQNKVVVVMITDFSVRCGGDYLELWEEGTPVKKTLCRSRYQPMVDEYYVSTSSNLRLRFNTVRTMYTGGFSLRYWFQGEQKPCGGNVARLTAASSFIQHPSVFEGKYSNHENCTWLISAPNDKWIRVYLHEMDIEEGGRDCPYDRLSFYAGQSMQGQVADGRCGSRAPTDSFLLTDNYAVINFGSDSSVTKNGFTASYEIVDGVRACGSSQPEQLNGLAGTIAIDYAEQYDNKLSCTWDIAVPSRYDIELEVDFFNVEDGPLANSCSYDGLMIVKNNDEYVDTWCGLLPEGHILRIDSSSLQLRFYSDGNTVEAGFRINFRAVASSVTPSIVPPTPTTGSGGSSGGTYGLYIDGDEVKQGECGVPAVGRTSSYSRLVGGTEAVAHSNPWIVSVQSSGHFCGATIIAERWVITAAHCVDNFPTVLINLVLGEHDLSLPETPPSVSVGVEQKYIRSDYNRYTLENDIALLYTDAPIPFSDFVMPACIPEEDYPTNRPACVIAGWGETEGTGNYKVLQRAQVPIMPTSTCTQDGWAYQNNNIKSTMFCAGYENGGIDTCQGDSGGPLVCPESDGSWYLHGITSWGYGCAEPKTPGVYTRVSSYHDWISRAILSRE